MCPIGKKKLACYRSFSPSWELFWALLLIPKPGQVCSSNMCWPAHISQVCTHSLPDSAQIQSVLLRLYMQEKPDVAHVLDIMLKRNFLCVLIFSTFQYQFSNFFLCSSAQFKPYHEADMGKTPKSYPNLWQFLEQFHPIIHELSVWVFSPMQCLLLWWKKK